jgi:hypothetical protein
MNHVKAVVRKWRSSRNYSGGLVVILPTETNDGASMKCLAFDGDTKQLVSVNFFEMTSKTTPVPDSSEHRGVLADLLELGYSPEVVARVTVAEITAPFAKRGS